MAAAKLDELKADLAELTKFMNLAERQRVKDLILIEKRKLETEIANIHESLKMEIDSTGNDIAGKKIVTPAPKRCYDVKITNYAWDQSDKFVKIFVTLNNVHTIPEDNVHCNFEPSSVEMTVKALENRNYTFTMKNLLENIDVGNSKWKVKKDMVVIFLSKSQNKKWTYLTTVEKLAKEPKSSLPKMDPNEDPTTGLMDLMKKMYEEGDDDMKRTIAQSWTESANKSRMSW